MRAARFLQFFDAKDKSAAISTKSDARFMDFPLTRGIVFGPPPRDVPRLRPLDPIIAECARFWSRITLESPLKPGEIRRETY
jgi:hypothetical protein